MKHLETCNKILANKQITVEELTHFLVDYCSSQGKDDKDISNNIQLIVQLTQMGTFDIIHAIKEYTKANDKQFYSMLKNDEIIKQWIV